MPDSHQLCLVQNIPSPPEWIRTPRELSLSSLPSLHSLATSKLRSVSMDLSILDVSCKRHHNLCTTGVWHLSRSTGVWVHRVVICINTPFIFTLCNIPPWAGVLCNLSLQPSVDGHLGYFYLWIIVLLPSQVLSSTVHRPPSQHTLNFLFSLLYISQKTLEMQVGSLGQEDPLEEETAAHSRILARKSSRTEESGRLQSMGSQKSDTTVHTATRPFGKTHINVSVSPVAFLQGWEQKRGCG